MIKNIYLFVCLIIFIFLIIIIIKINYYFNTIENFKYGYNGYNCFTCASCAGGGYLIDTTDKDSNIISSQNNGEFNYFKFVNNGADDEKIYFFNVYTDLTCDILIIGGGGSGGGNKKWNENPGGGAGGIVYIVNQVLPAKTYKIKVGRGGIVQTVSSKLYPENGHDSSITDLDDNVIVLSVVLDSPDKTIKLIGYGGGHGAYFDGHYNTWWGSPAPPGGNGGSGGGSLYYGYGGTSTQGDTFWDGTEFVKGGHDGEKASYYARGGGGAGGKADVARGGHGRQINITGETSHTGNILYYGGGGGGGGGGNTGYGGNGGGGPVGNAQRSGYPGREHTGGGGGGARGYTLGGSGGSGMVVIRYL